MNLSSSLCSVSCWLALAGCVTAPLEETLHWRGEAAVEEVRPLLVDFFEKILAGEDGGLAVDRLSEDFEGAWPVADQWRASAPGDAFTSAACTVEWGLEKEPIDFVEGLLSFAEEFDRIEESEVHVTRVESLGSDEDPMLELELETSWFGIVSDERRGDRLRWRASLVRRGQEWFLAALVTLECNRVIGRPLLVDVSAALPPSAHRTHPRSSEFLNTTFNGVSLADWDGDDDLDLWIARPFQTPLWLENDGRGSFSALVPPNLTTRSTDVAPSERGAAYFVDLNNDGRLEMLELGHGPRPRLFAFVGEVYVDVSRLAGLGTLPAGEWVGAASADFDLDGLLDLYLFRYSRPGQHVYFDRPGESNFLLRNRGGLVFEDVTVASGLDVDNRRATLAAAWADFDGDGIPDLYVANDFGPNSLYRGLRGGRFEEIAVEAGVEGLGNGMGVAWGDYDNDGLLDLHVSNMYSYAGARQSSALGSYADSSTREMARRFSKGNSLFRNLGSGRLLEVSPSGVENAQWAWGQSFVDLDLDGDLDLLVANGFFTGVEEGDT